MRTRRTLLLAKILLAGALLSVAPTATADSCPQTDPVEELACEASHADDVALCLATRPYMHWHHCRLPHD